jgi:hypothetical protein
VCVNGLNSMPARNKQQQQPPSAIFQMPLHSLILPWCSSAQQL